MATVVATGALGCGNECVELPAQCDPLYPPTYDNVFSRTLEVKCALSGGACHSAEGAMGGLIYEDPDEAYGLLVGDGGGDRPVLPGDPACSELVRRITSRDPDVQMPPGNRLSDQERCAIIQWIANGAER